MATYTIETQQTFSVTYVVDADSPEEAWDTLLNGDVNNSECVDQHPGPIVGEMDEAYIQI